MRFMALMLLLLTAGLPVAQPAWAGPPIWLLARSLDARLHQAPQGGGLAWASPPGAAASPGAACRAAIAVQEPLHGIPPHLLAAIGRVESGRPDGAGGVQPWPWSIDVDGTDHVYDTEAQAIQAVRDFQAQGARSIDVGCLQVNLLYHPDAFASLEQAFDPAANAAYAARFLADLRAQTGDWSTATAWYHSATPSLGADYARKVMGALAAERGQPEDLASAPVLAGMPDAEVSRGQVSRGAFMLAGTMAPARLASAGLPAHALAAYRARPIRVASALVLR